MLEVKNLDAGYGFLQVLWDVSLSVDTGEYIGLIGPSGAGKSTTLKSIGGLIEPFSGGPLVSDARFFSKAPRIYPIFIGSLSCLW